MNVSEQYYEEKLKPTLAVTDNLMKLLNGEVRTYASCDTLQVSDYGKYDMALFDEVHKKEQHEKQFPLDLKAAYEMGVKFN